MSLTCAEIILLAPMQVFEADKKSNKRNHGLTMFLDTMFLGMYHGSLVHGNIIFLVNLTNTLKHYINVFIIKKLCWTLF